MHGRSVEGFGEWQVCHVALGVAVQSRIIAAGCLATHLAFYNEQFESGLQALHVPVAPNNEVQQFGRECCRPRQFQYARNALRSSHVL